MPDLPVIPGADLPAATTAEIRRRWIMRRARISEHAVRLLTEMSLGTDDADGWPPVLPAPSVREPAYA